MMIRRAAAAVLVAAALVPAYATTGGTGADAAPGAHAAQSGVLDGPAVVRPGTTVRLRATFTPARRGRPVTLEVHAGGSWDPLRTKAQRRNGTVSFRITLEEATELRATTARWRRTRAFATDPITVRVEDPQPGRTPWVTGYYAGWFWENMYPPEEVDMEAMTHFVFGRVAPGGGSLAGEPGELVPGAGTGHHPGRAPDGSGRSVEDYLVDRAHDAGTRALLMLGGDGLDGVGFVRSTADARRAAFVEEIADYLVEHDYDGVDLDWENCLAGEAHCGVGAVEARRRLMALIGDLRAELATRPRYAETPALITFPGYAVNVNFLEEGGRVEQWQADVANAVDQYNLMTYGVGTTWWGHGTGWHSWFTGALAGAGSGWPVDISSSIAAYVATGVPRERLGIGIGFYGIYYGPAIDGPREYDPDNDIYEVQDASLGYSELVRKGYLDHGQLQWDEEASSTYRTYGGDGYVPSNDANANPAGMLSYEDERSIAAKGAWVREQGVGGTIIWTINYGYLPRAGTNPLLDATAEAFLGR